MPLFECSKCGTVDNTALTNFWWDVKQEKKPALCSECDPAIGKWHGKFRKSTVAEYNAKCPQCPVEYPLDPTPPKRNPLDPSTWGSQCARGVPYKNVGPTTDGAKNQRRSISSGRKQRGSSSDDLERQEARKRETEREP